MKFCPQCEHEYDDQLEVCPQDGNRLVKLHIDAEGLVGRTIDDRFQVVEKIGEGGMGTVYLAIQRPIGRKVALKVLSRSLAADDAAVKRFFHEAKVVSKLRHPNTITMYDFGQSREDLLYIAMEYMTGESLDRVMAKDLLTLREVLEIIQQVCESLSEAHHQGIIHRDLKPENIFIDRVGSQNIVKVLDFGIAKIQGTQSNLTLTGMVFGTPAYMSPEQSQGFKLDQRADLYSLGVVLFELLCGRLPYEGDTAMKVAMAHILEPVPDPNAHTLYRPLPPKLAELVISLLAKDKELRPANAEEVLERLRAINRELGESPLPTRLALSTQQGRAETVPLGAIEERSSQRVLIRERPGQPTPDGSGARPTATGPQRPKELFDTANYKEYATAKYSDGEYTEERLIPPEILEARARKWGYWATVGLVLLSATILLILFGPRTRDGFKRLGGMDDFSPAPPIAPWDKPDDALPDQQTPATVIPEATAAGDRSQPATTEPQPQPALAPGHEATLVGSRTGATPPLPPGVPMPEDRVPVPEDQVAAIQPEVAPPVAPIATQGAVPGLPPSGEESAETEVPTVTGGGPMPGEAIQVSAGTEPSPTFPEAPRPAPEPAGREQGQPTDLASVPPQPSTVTLSIRTVPGRARIVRADNRQEVCRTVQRNPCQVELPYGRDEIRLEVLRRRYQPQEFVFVPDHCGTYEITLSRRTREISPPVEDTGIRPFDEPQPTPADEGPAAEQEETPAPQETPAEGGIQLMVPVTFPSPPSDEQNTDP